jgi:sec-independent protein translocase protein TatC
MRFAERADAEEKARAQAEEAAAAAAAQAAGQPTELLP